MLCNPSQAFNFKQYERNNINNHKYIDGREMGCNAIINMRYDANDVMSGFTEVLAYGTAVVVEKIN
jgi:uncharacterized protein YbjQ (UPF0145 family)